MVEELWWKTLDFAALRRCSISFNEIEKQETVISKWSRAKTTAAKLGKGLSKDENAQKLALQHWLEAIDPRHRYVHNLHFYYDVWSASKSSQPFFYWLDIGDGKELSLKKCQRTSLQQQCINYLRPKEREAFEVIVVESLFTSNPDYLLTPLMIPSGFLYLAHQDPCMLGRRKKVFFSTQVSFPVGLRPQPKDWWFLKEFLRLFGLTVVITSQLKIISRNSLFSLRNRM